MHLRLHLGSGSTRLAALVAACSLLLPAAPAVAAGAGTVFPGRATVNPEYSLTTKASDTTFNCQLPTTTNPCYGPSQIQNAYGVDDLLRAGLSGRGRAIVIVDAFGNPYIKSDLQIFDQTFGLPDPDFKVLNPYHATFDITNDDDVGWSGEISLDVQWAHAIAPHAKIRLVVAKSDQDIDIYNATKWAIDHNVGDVISQSFGEGEACLDTDPRIGHQSFVDAQHALFERATRKGITLIASSGDDGAAQPDCNGDSGDFLSASTPAADPLVTGIGGTNLTADLTTGRYGNEVAWGDGYGESGGGFSVEYRRPTFQNGIRGISRGARGVPDVAYNAGVYGGVLAHWGVGLAAYYGLDPTDPTAFFIFGGTSAGSPQWAGLVALADQLGHHRLGDINPDLYAIASNRFLYGAAFHDVTSGDNVIDGVGGYQTSRGWDPVTGLGTPKANILVPLLAAASFGHGHHGYY